MRDELLLRLLLNDEFMEADETENVEGEVETENAVTTIDPEAVNNFWIQYVNYLNKSGYNTIQTKDSSSGKTIKTEVGYIQGDANRVRINGNTIELPITVIKGEQNIAKFSGLIKSISDKANKINTKSKKTSTKSNKKSSKKSKKDNTPAGKLAGYTKMG